MRILFLADLHIYNKQKLLQHKGWIDQVIVDNDPDVVVILGDIFETSYKKINPYKKVAEIVGDRKAICVLGNHEFYHKTVNSVMDEYREMYNPDKYDVHYLDVVDSYDVGNVHFFGNVLWYDGSLSNVPQDLSSFANGAWCDKYIHGHDLLFSRECMSNFIKIQDNMGTEDQINILCTHCVPHKSLNGHFNNPPSPYNAYSGVSDLFFRLMKDGEEKCGIDYAFSGHTHWKVDEVDLYGCKCFNVGNDYYAPHNYYILDV
jgi:predicted MPP superfamily phosphohydrolase